MSIIYISIHEAITIHKILNYYYYNFTIYNRPYRASPLPTCLYMSLCQPQYVNIVNIQGEPEIDMYSHNYFNFTMLLLMGKRLLHISISGSPYICLIIDRDDEHRIRHTCPCLLCASSNNLYNQCASFLIIIVPAFLSTLLLWFLTFFLRYNLSKGPCTSSRSISLSV